MIDLLRASGRPFDGPQYNAMGAQTERSIYSFEEREARALEATRKAQEYVGFDRAVEIMASLSPSDHWLRVALVAYGRPSAPTERSVITHDPLPREILRRPGKISWLKRKDHPALRSANPEQFIEKVYGDRLGRGFTQADLRTADMSLYSALHRWLAENTLSIDLPTLAQWNDRQIQSNAMDRRTIYARYNRRSRNLNTPDI